MDWDWISVPTFAIVCPEDRDGERERERVRRDVKERNESPQEYSHSTMYDPIVLCTLSTHIRLYVSTYVRTRTCKGPGLLIILPELCAVRIPKGSQTNSSERLCSLGYQ